MVSKTKTYKVERQGVASINDGIVYFTCVYCQYSGAIIKHGNSWDIGNFSRHLNKQTLECPNRQNVSDFSTSSSADHIMETDDVSVIFS